MGWVSRAGPRKGAKMESPESWVMVWLALAALFLIGEIFIAGTFYLGPFGVSAAIAMVLAMLGVPIALQWAVFIVAGALLFWWALRWSQRFQAGQSLPVGIGADRLVGEIGRVIAQVPATTTASGRVQIGGEEWAAETGNGEAIDPDTIIKVLEVRGTRVIVTPHTDTTEGTRR